MIVVGLNARQYVRECFASLRNAQWSGLTWEWIYVDNGSTDQTLEMLAQQFPEVKTIANSSNLGFCKAANQAASLANSSSYFFLNDDTLVLDDAIPLLARVLDARPEVGVVASRLLNTDLTDQWSGGRRFPGPATFLFGRRSPLARFFSEFPTVVRYLYKREMQGAEPFPADWVSAAALMVRAEAFHSIGGFAEDYYYWHEVVFCDRIRRTGREVLLHPLSKIVHHEGKGSGPRPFHRQKWHILDFHRGAYRCYCEHYNLGRLHPLRWFAAAAMASRAAALLAAARLATIREEG